MELAHVVVVGASLGGTRTVEALRRDGYEGRITVIGAEAHEPYQRPPLSKQVLAGEWPRSTVDLRTVGLNADFRLSTRATALDLDAREVVVEGPQGQERLGFDGLVIATGCDPRLLPDLPRPGEIAGLYALRTVDDCLALRAELERSPRVAIVGAGFIGCEVAAVCRRRGAEVTIIDPVEAPLAPVLGVRMGEVVGALHGDHGVTVRMRTGVSGLVGDGRVEGVRLDDGGVVEADVVVLGLGVAPATGWLEGSGLRLDNGVVCDSTCRAEGAAGVVAVGDVARWFHPSSSRYLRVEHFDNVAAQAVAASRALLDPGGARPYDPVPSFWSDQYDVKLQLLGLPERDDDVEILEGDPGDHRFIAAYGRDGRTTAVLAMNEPERVPAFERLVAEGAAFPPQPGAR